MTEIAAVGFIPSAPLLVPAVAGGSAALDADLREACRSVVRTVCETDADAVVVAATWQDAARWPSDATWGFEGFGVVREPADDRPRLPWPLGLGAWFLDDAGWDGLARQELQWPRRQFLPAQRCDRRDAVGQPALVRVERRDRQ